MLPLQRVASWSKTTGLRAAPRSSCHRAQGQEEEMCSRSAGKCRVLEVLRLCRERGILGGARTEVELSEAAAPDLSTCALLARAQGSEALELVTERSISRRIAEEPYRPRPFDAISPNG